MEHARRGVLGGGLVPQGEGCGEGRGKQGRRFGEPRRRRSTYCFRRSQLRNNPIHSALLMARLPSALRRLLAAVPVPTYLCGKQSMASTVNSSTRRSLSSSASAIPSSKVLPANFVGTNHPSPATAPKASSGQPQVRQCGTSSVHPVAAPPAADHSVQTSSSPETQAPSTRVPALGAVVAIAGETPTCVRVTIRVHGGNDGATTKFAFEAGQWVDMWPADSTEAGVGSAVGGYSIASHPRDLAADGTIELVVKRSRHPVATWLHDSARVGDNVYVCAGGGDALRVDAAELAHHAVLVAGGIGITPLMSILREVAHVAQTRVVDNHGSTAPIRTSVLYSTKSEDEFALLPAMRAAAEAASPRLEVDFHLRVTAPLGAVSPGMQVGRIERSHIADVVSKLAAAPRAALMMGGAKDDVAMPTAFVCGPPAMADDVIAHLVSCGLMSDRIKCERWW